MEEYIEKELEFYPIMQEEQEYLLGEDGYLPVLKEEFTETVKEPVAETPIEGQSVYATMLEALTASKRIPRKKDDQKKWVTDYGAINRAEGHIPEGEHILFAYYNDMCFISGKAKVDKYGMMKLPFLDKLHRILTITENYMVVADVISADRVVLLDKKQVVSVKYVFKKKILSVGQVQIELDDDRFLVVTVYKESVGESPEEHMKQFQEITEHLILPG